MRFFDFNWKCTLGVINCNTTHTFRLSSTHKKVKNSFLFFSFFLIRFVSLNWFCLFVYVCICSNNSSVAAEFCSTVMWGKKWSKTAHTTLRHCTENRNENFCDQRTHRGTDVVLNVVAVVAAVANCVYERARSFWRFVAHWARAATCAQYGRWTRRPRVNQP